MEFLAVNHRCPSREMPLGLLVKKDGSFHKLYLAGFHTGPLSRSNWNLGLLVFVEEEKLECLEKF